MRINKGTESCVCDSSPVVTAGNKNKTNRLFIWLGIGLVLWIALYYLIQPAADFLTYSVFRLVQGSHFASSVAFFLYDAPKVILLLVIVVFVVGIVRSFFTPERTQRILAGKREAVGNVLAASLGIVTPFCTCSAVPLFIGFVQVGIPLGVTFSFLIAAPMINEVAVVLLYGMFGWRVALLYVVTPHCPDRREWQWRIRPAKGLCSSGSRGI